ncbi:S9 family peptidase, partial [Rhizobium ruizarguesonis]
NLGDLLDGRLLVGLQQDWTPAPGGRTFKQGSLVALDLAAVERDPAHLSPTIVFEPGPRESLEGFTTTHSRLIADIYENVKG